MTTKDIIKILPFDEKLKIDLLEGFDFLKPDQKFDIEQALWDVYYAFYDLKLEENLKLAFLRAKDNQEKLDQDFYKRVREKTDKEMQEGAVQNIQNVDLEAARKAMEKIIREIRASKKPIN